MIKHDSCCEVHFMELSLLQAANSSVARTYVLVGECPHGACGSVTSLGVVPGVNKKILCNHCVHGNRRLSWRGGQNLTATAVRSAVRYTCTVSTVVRTCDLFDFRDKTLELKFPTNPWFCCQEQRMYWVQALKIESVPHES